MDIMARVWRFSLYALGRTLAFSGSIAAMGVLLFQALRWLQQGRWTPMPLKDAFVAIDIRLPASAPVDAFLGWVLHPASWLGLHRLVLITPTAFACLIVALLGVIVAARGRSSRSEPDRTAAPRFLPMAPREAAARLEGGLGALEADILRWLAMNEADDRLNTADVMCRHLKHDPAAIRAGLSLLVHGDFVQCRGPHHRLSTRGHAYCFDQGWTMALPARP